MRGDLLLQKGNKKEAEADYEAVIQKDTIADGGSCRQYALLSLGRDKEAEEWMERIIESDPDDAGNYYDKACLLARMGKLNESIAALRTAFEKGYRSFSHIRLDDDMDAVRNLPEFKALVEEYEAIHSEYLKKSELAIPEKEEEYTEIALKRNPGGTFEIPCDINGLSLQMIFDTGASDVTISSVEANFMLKNGYLSEKDIKGKRYYQIASGELSAGTIITLREVRIGDAVLKNVDASVVKSQKAPLLLGQSAMERFGTITIDNQNNKLIIKH
jgi:clan AA aspartic protease (TIGR02281 family)